MYPREVYQPWYTYGTALTGIKSIAHLYLGSSIRHFMMLYELYTISFSSLSTDTCTVAHIYMCTLLIQHDYIYKGIRKRDRCNLIKINLDLTSWNIGIVHFLSDLDFYRTRDSLLSQARNAPLGWRWLPYNIWTEYTIP